jgi:hypothetical protein
VHDFKTEEEELVEMRRLQNLRVAGTVAALLAAMLALSVLGWAAGDTPIVIADGSLNIQSAVPWSQYTGAGDIKSHPHTTKSVSSVVLTVGGKNQTIKFAGEPCKVEFVYAGDHIVLSTGADGKGLTMQPFGVFGPGQNGNFLAHKNAHAKISHVIVMKGSRQVFDSDAVSGTRIAIHYQ